MLRKPRSLIDRIGDLLILDKVMRGIGYTSTTHTWKKEDIVPDTQAIGEELGEGHAAISGLLIHDRIVAGLKAGSEMRPNISVSSLGMCRSFGSSTDHLGAHSK